MQLTAMLLQSRMCAKDSVAEGQLMGCQGTVNGSPCQALAHLHLDPADGDRVVRRGGVHGVEEVVCEAGGPQSQPVCWKQDAAKLPGCWSGGPVHGELAQSW
jgi:hypothetical protein